MLRALPYLGTALTSSQYALVLEGRLLKDSSKLFLSVYVKMFTVFSIFLHSVESPKYLHSNCINTIILVHEEKLHSGFLWSTFVLQIDSAQGIYWYSLYRQCVSCWENPFTDSLCLEASAVSGQVSWLHCFCACGGTEQPGKWWGRAELVTSWHSTGS